MRIRRCLLGINRPKSTILAHYCVKNPCNPSRIPSDFLRVLHSKSRILWCIRSFGLGIFRLREVKKRSHTGVCLRFFAHYQRKITSQNRLLPKKHRRLGCIFLWQKERVRCNTELVQKQLNI